MPRVSREQTDHHRDAIADASARLFRERGFQGVSVADLMAAAGLTHGGFYGHFASKDALLASACGKAFAQSSQRWRGRAAAAATPPQALRAIVDAYLSPASRDQAGTSCPAAALAADVARAPAGAPVRRAYLDGVKALLDQLASLSAAPDPAGRRAAALLQLSALVGALVLARATGGDPLSDDVLRAVRGFLCGKQP